jgi:ligand-binding sensor domain-containing protein
MKRANILAMLCMFIFCSLGFTNRDWEQAKGIQEADMQDVCVSPFDNTIYASTEKTLYRSDDKGDNWSAVFSSQGEDDKINFIGISEKGIFICAQKGLFKSEDGKSNWKRVFEDNAAHIAFSKDGKAFLGTKKGLFISMDNGLTWQKDLGEISNLNVRWVEFIDGTIFVASEKGLYKNIDNGWKRTFVTNRAEMEYDADIVDEDNQAIKPVNSMAAGKDNIFLATDSGIFFSEDKGDTLKEFIDTGLASLKVKRLICKDNFYAATNKGVFMFFEQEKLWKPLYKGMPTKDTAVIAIDANGNLWAATKKGLYKKQCQKNIDF